MTSFSVSPKVFEILPDYCLGIVVAKGIDNHAEDPRITALLDQAIADFAAAHSEDNIRELPSIKSFRDAFLALEMNPNKFMCSIEALTKRVQKSQALPHINPIVDLGNAFSVRYLLPMGAHDMDKMSDALEVRFSTPEDHFLPMGEEAVETMPEGELVYVNEHTVKTRRWIWRQSDDGKITEETSNIFFPIDAFSNVSGKEVMEARNGLAAFLKEELHCEVAVGFIDKDHTSFTL